MRRLVCALLAVLLVVGIAAASSNYVVITAKGKKYHVEGCRTVKKAYQKLTVDEAKKKGYKPCKVCNP